MTCLGTFAFLYATASSFFCMFKRAHAMCISTFREHKPELPWCIIKHSIPINLLRLSHGVLQPVQRKNLASKHAWHVHVKPV